MAKEYWYCIIGPTTRAELNKREAALNSNGMDQYLRIPVQLAFERLMLRSADSCSSGWGITEECARHMSFASDNEELKASIVASYEQEGKKMPRHILAWKLLLEHEKKTKRRKK